MGLADDGAGKLHCLTCPLPRTNELSTFASIQHLEHIGEEILQAIDFPLNYMGSTSVVPLCDDGDNAGHRQSESIALRTRLRPRRLTWLNGVEAMASI